MKSQSVWPVLVWPVSCLLSCRRLMDGIKFAQCILSALPIPSEKTEIRWSPACLLMQQYNKTPGQIFPGHLFPCKIVSIYQECGGSACRSHNEITRHHGKINTIRVTYILHIPKSARPLGHHRRPYSKLPPSLPVLGLSQGLTQFQACPVHSRMLSASCSLSLHFAL